MTDAIQRELTPAFIANPLPNQVALLSILAVAAQASAYASSQKSTTPVVATPIETTPPLQDISRAVAALSIIVMAGAQLKKSDSPYFNQGKKESVPVLKKQDSPSILRPKERQEKSVLIEHTPPLTLPQPTSDIYNLCLRVELMNMAYDYMQMEVNEKEIEVAHKERERLHKERLEVIDEEAKRTRIASNWSTAASVFSWMTSSLEIFAGAFLIASGNPVSGILLVIGGTTLITNQVMNITGVWDKVADLLPGEDENEKRAILNWMQLSIGIFSLMLGGAGGVLAGKTAFSAASSISSMFMGSTFLFGKAVCDIGKGIAGKKLQDTYAATSTNTTALRKHDFIWKDLVERQEHFLSRLTKGADFIKTVFDMETSVSNALAQAMVG